MKIKNKIAAALLSLVVLLTFSGCGSATPSSYTINLEVWGLFDDSVVFESTIEAYRKLNPYVGDIKYKKFTPDSYKQDLLEALASGQGPDIVLIQNNWLPSFENKLAPIPAAITGEQELRSNFVDVVFDNFLSKGKMYALPLSVDSLALYYNKDMFNAAGIASPPVTWEEFSADVSKLTKINPTGGIDYSGAAMGTAKNINRAPDILSLLMYQNGAEMPTSDKPTAIFDQGVIGKNGQTVQAGVNALTFYTNFARNPLAMSWNSRMHYSVDAFAEGNLGMMFNYSWQIATLKSQNPKLNFAVAQIPQANSNKPVNYANYWAYAVAKNKTEPATATGQGGGPMSQAKNDARVHEAWQFLKFLTMKNNGSIHLVNALTKNAKDFPVNLDPAAEYIKKTQKPAARRDLIEVQKNDATFGPFAYGNLIAKSWYQADPIATDLIFNEVIDSVVRGDMTAVDALRLASNRINSINQNLKK